MGILQSRSQNGRTLYFGYDKYLQLQSIVNEGREKYRFELDGLGRVSKEIGFDDIQKEYIRDGLGRVTEVIRPDGRWTKYSYNNLSQVVLEEHYDATQTAFRYDADGRLTEALNEEGKLEFKRDKAGRIIQETQGNGHSVNHLYDKNGYLTKTTSSLGANIDMTYNEEGDLASMQAGDTWRADWQRDNTGLELHRQLTGGVSIHTKRDYFGREIQKSIGVNNVEKSCKNYQWGIANRLQGIEDEITGAYTSFDYDALDNLIRADYKEKSGVESIYGSADVIGNFYESDAKSDRKYSKGGRLIEDLNFHYHYDVEGNLCFKEFKKNQGYTNFAKRALEEKYKIKFRTTGTGWEYQWAANGMLKRVINPQQGKITFGYDALGRRTYKETKHKRINWLWNGNVPLHEWDSHKEEALIDIITWVFEGGFVPCAKVTKDKSYSIVSDYLGTSTQMYDEEGTKTWDAQLDIYGRVRTFSGGSLSDCPFRYQGQYQDEETGLYYNRFRYYDANVGNYISKDPIGLEGGNPTLYGYVHDPNRWVDPLGLSENPFDYLYEGLKQQGFKPGDSIPSGLKQSWEVGTTKYEVRIHPKDSNRGTGDIFRVSRKEKSPFIVSPDGEIRIGQGKGTEYLGTDGKWYSEKVLKENYKGGKPNPSFDNEGAKKTHIDKPNTIPNNH